MDTVGRKWIPRFVRCSVDEGSIVPDPAFKGTIPVMSPVVAESGKVIGLARTSNGGASYDMTSLRDVARLHPGRIENLRLTVDAERVLLAGTIIDPFRQIRTISAMIGPSASQGHTAKRAFRGSEIIKPYLPEQEAFQNELPKLSKNSRKAVQLRIVRGDGRSEVTNPIDYGYVEPISVAETQPEFVPSKLAAARTDLTVQMTAAASKPTPPAACAIPLRTEKIPARGLDYLLLGRATPPPVEQLGAAMDSPRHIVPCTFFSKDGTYAYILQRTGFLLKVSVPDLVIRGYVDVDGEVSDEGRAPVKSRSLWASPTRSGIAVSVFDDNQIRFFDPESLQHTGSVGVSQPSHMASSWNTDRLIATSRWAPQAPATQQPPTNLVIVDTNSVSIVRRVGGTRSSLLSKFSSFDSLVMTPDTHSLFATHSGELARFIVGDAVITPVERCRSKGIPVVSSDSRYVTAGHRVFRSGQISKSMLSLPSEVRQSAVDATNERLFGLTSEEIIVFDSEGIRLHSFALPKTNRLGYRKPHLSLRPGHGQLFVQSRGGSAFSTSTPERKSPVRHLCWPAI